MNLKMSNIKSNILPESSVPLIECRFTFILEMLAQNPSTDSTWDWSMRLKFGSGSHRILLLKSNFCGRASKAINSTMSWRHLAWQTWQQMLTSVTWGKSQEMRWPAWDPSHKDPSWRTWALTHACRWEWQYCLCVLPPKAFWATFWVKGQWKTF